MDTNQKHQMLTLCEQALESYSAIEAAIERGSGRYAKERLKELKSFLKNQTQHSAFRSANAYLPQASANPGHWKPEISYSKSYIEAYLRELQRKS